MGVRSRHTLHYQKNKTKQKKPLFFFLCKSLPYSFTQKICWYDEIQFNNRILEVRN